MLALYRYECYYTSMRRGLSSTLPKKYNGLTMKKWHTRREGPVPPISVVLAVYNKARDLELCLESYRRQSLKDFELILADDGSKPDIEALCKRFAESVAFPFTYLWQEDKGWGKPRMLNLAAIEARSERLVFTDGDCVPHRHFMRAHLRESRPDAVACGRRVDLFDKVSAALTLEDIRKGTLESPAWLIRKALAKEIDFGHQGLYFPYVVARGITSFYRAPRLLGSNMGVHKNRLLEINGFDETFTVPGVGEDTDMQRRFELASVKIRWITYRAVQYHLWHKLTPVGKEAHAIYDNLKSLNRKTAVKGIKELTPA